jgi:hypothetical protein
VIGLAQTGSGKTGAFSLPILQSLMDKPQEFFALVLSPTRELAIQIAEQIEALGAGIGVRCAVLVGGIDIMAQAIALAKRPHVVVGTPGRVVDHLSNTKVGKGPQGLVQLPQHSGVVCISAVYSARQQHHPAQPSSHPYRSAGLPPQAPEAPGA